MNVTSSICILKRQSSKACRTPELAPNSSIKATTIELRNISRAGSCQSGSCATPTCWSCSQRQFSKCIPIRTLLTQYRQSGPWTEANLELTSQLTFGDQGLLLVLPASARGSLLRLYPTTRLSYRPWMTSRTHTSSQASKKSSTTSFQGTTLPSVTTMSKKATF